MIDIDEIYEKALAGKFGANTRAVGWTCNYVPEEIIYAANLLPYRVTGHVESTTPLADQHLQPNVCGFARSCLDKALRGGYSFLQGMVLAHTCDTFCKMCDIWRDQVRPPFLFQLNTPHRIDAGAQEFYARELRSFKEALSNYFGVEITDQDIKKAIDIYNENRLLLKKVSSLRKADLPKITGTQMIQLLLVGMMMPKAENNELLRKLIADLETSSNDIKRPGVRLMISGGPLDDTTSVEIIEEYGARVVYEDVCTGGRYYWNQVETGIEDPYFALAKHYLTKVSCPCMHPGDRFDHIEEIIKEYKVDGVIFYSPKFCDTHLHSIPSLEDALDLMKIPSLVLETDHTATALGQLRTRIQAFIESIS